MSDQIPRKEVVKNHPATGVHLGSWPVTTSDELANMVKRARQAQMRWAALPARERGKKVCGIGRVVADRANELAALICSDTGKPFYEALWGEVFIVSSLAHYFGKRTHKILKPRFISAYLLKYRRSYLHFAPRGLVGVIAPWNFPFSLGFGDVIMALAAGNAVIFKPSEVTPRIGIECQRIIEQAGLDPELLQVAMGGGETGAAVTECGLDLLHFTGSVATGKKIAAKCGELLLPVVLELGGKNAALVLEDADLEETARSLVFGAFFNAGQACASVGRVYVHEAVYESLLKRLKERTSALRQGDGSQDDVELGPVIHGPQLAIVERHVNEARHAGAIVESGGVAKQGRYFAPTLITNVDDTMAICRDETFGPVMPVMKFRTVEEAIERANSTDYGLTAYVFTRNVKRGRRIAERLRAGTILVNDTLITHGCPETPWGGVKNSGIGITHSAEGLRGFCEQRHVNYDLFPMPIAPWKFPYGHVKIPPSLAVFRGLFGSGHFFSRTWLLLRGALGLVKALANDRSGQQKL